MNKLICFLNLMLLTILCLSCNQSVLQSEQVSNDELKKMISEKNARISEFYREGLADSVASFFAENAIQMAPNMEPTRGREKIKESWGQSMQFGIWNFTLNTKEVKGCNNMAVELGEYTLEFTPNENSPIPQMSDKGNYVVLWEKINGEWRVVWDAPVSDVPFPR